MALHTNQVFEIEQRTKAAAEDAAWTSRWQEKFAPEIEKIRFNAGRGMSRQRLEKIYGALKVNLALGSPGS